MDLEAKRIKTRITFPFIPMTNPPSILVKLPATAGSRNAGCTTGWALSKLGVSSARLTATKAPLEAVMAHTGDSKSTAFSYAGFLNKVVELNDKAQLKGAIEALQAGVNSNRATLERKFGASNVRALATGVDKILADYRAVDVEVMPPSRRGR